MDESTTRALLTRVLAEAPPPAPVDLDRVAELGEAYRRRRTRWVVATAAAVVVTVAVAVLTTGTNTDRAAPPANRPSAEAPPVGSLPRTAPAQFDPTHSQIQVSGAPTTLTERGTALFTTDLVYYAYDESGKLLQVFVNAKGYKSPILAQNNNPKATAGPTIRGHSSRWYNAKDLGYLLRWQWAPGADAYVTVRGLPNPLALATRIASSLTVNLSTPTRLPYTLRSPSGFQLKEFVTLNSKVASPSAIVAYGGPGPSYVSVNANPLGNGIGKPNATYQGRPARVTQVNGLTSVVMAAADLKVTGTCNYRSNAKFTAAQFKTLCVATTVSVKRVADLRTPKTWPVFAPQ